MLEAAETLEDRRSGTDLCNAGQEWGLGGGLVGAVLRVVDGA